MERLFSAYENIILTGKKPNQYNFRSFCKEITLLTQLTVDESNLLDYIKDNNHKIKNIDQQGSHINVQYHTGDNLTILLLCQAPYVVDQNQITEILTYVRRSNVQKQIAYHQGEIEKLQKQIIPTKRINVQNVPKPASHKPQKLTTAVQAEPVKQQPNPQQQLPAEQKYPENSPKHADHPDHEKFVRQLIRELTNPIQTAEAEKQEPQTEKHPAEAVKHSQLPRLEPGREPEQQAQAQAQAQVVVNDVEGLTYEQVLQLIFGCE